MNVTKDQVEKALNALRQLDEKKKESKQSQLFDTNEHIHLSILQKQVPTKPHRYFVQLPHSTVDEDEEVCVFVRDPQKYYRKVFADLGVTRVNKIIGVQKLRRKYSTYESRRKLHASYKRFLVDDRIVLMLPKLIGKTFFERSSAKFPIPINMDRKPRIVKGVARGLNSTSLFMSTGPTSTLIIGRLSFTAEQLHENIQATMNYLKTRLPSGLDNIQSLDVKIPDSINLPIYRSLPQASAPSTDAPSASGKVAQPEKTTAPSATESDQKKDLNSKKEKQAKRKLSNVSSTEATSEPPQVPQNEKAKTEKAPEPPQTKTTQDTPPTTQEVPSKKAKGGKKQQDTEESKAQEKAAAPTPKAQEKAAAPTPKAQEKAAAPTPKGQEKAATPTPKAQEKAAAPTPKAQEKAAAPTPKGQEKAATPTPKAQEKAAAPTPKAQEKAAAPTPKAQEKTAAPTPKTAEKKGKQSKK
eukprot:TRINITY_DN2884_c0_g1_i3.p1 TRINITY_DN2884_c0_g1~~TRINITY_DN2884_c0_g1_i3.p1  ORF type:complete len:468 (+),score=123.79 TRINITY_DN2884_c0_g1_i3:41-1444(+)